MFLFSCLCLEEEAEAAMLHGVTQVRRVSHPDDVILSVDFINN